MFRAMFKVIGACLGLLFGVLASLIVLRILAELVK